MSELDVEPSGTAADWEVRAGPREPGPVPGPGVRLRAGRGDVHPSDRLLPSARRRSSESLGLDEAQVGYLMSAFLVAYGVFQVPGGLLGDRLGGRRVLTILVLGWSLLTGAVALAVLLPPVAMLPFVFLLVLRFLFGMFQAGGFPTLGRVIADWMPVTERGSRPGGHLDVQPVGRCA